MSSQLQYKDIASNKIGSLLSRSLLFGEGYDKQVNI